MEQYSLLLEKELDSITMEPKKRGRPKRDPQESAAKKIYADTVLLEQLMSLAEQEYPLVTEILPVANKNDSLIITVQIPKIDNTFDNYIYKIKLNKSIVNNDLTHISKMFIEELIMVDEDIKPVLTIAAKNMIEYSIKEFDDLVRIFLKNADATIREKVNSQKERTEKFNYIKEIIKANLDYQYGILSKDKDTQEKIKSNIEKHYKHAVTPLTSMAQYNSMKLQLTTLISKMEAYLGNIDAQNHAYDSWIPFINRMYKVRYER